MKIVLFFAAFSGMLSVILGAFAAHGLKNKLSVSQLETFQIGVQYQMYHSLALILVVILYRQMPQSLLVYSAGFMLAGMLFFSGSLYVLAITQIKWFGPITPLGGLFFIIGWALLMVSVVKGVGY
ncbi:DUF423 domain-containing protein [Paraglaciecola sp. 2405UD69-4]|uniref:DUF423 domain-containing protein n=1 Tax=Paraglaciecola sp. 2405UD69-4 TaxID=3391836 RepID=UPI0039C915A5